MHRTRRPSRSRRLLLVVAALALLATACGNSDDNGSTASSKSSSGGGSGDHGPGVTDDEIRFSLIGTKANNPLGTCILDCYQDGVEAYFAYRNSQGGVEGRKLVVSKVLDDELAQNQVKALEVVTDNDTFATFDATQLANGFADLAEAGIPLYVWTLNVPEMTGQESIWGNREVPCITCSRRGDAYVAELAGAKKVAVLGYGIAEASKDCAAGTRASIEKYGADVGGAEVAYFNDDLAFGLSNGVGPEVTAMKKAGVDLVIGCMDLNGQKTLAQELKRQGMDDVTLYHTNSYDQDFVADAGDLFEGDYVSAAFRPFEAGANKGLATYKTWMKKTGSKLTEVAMFGWINADLAYQGIKAAGADFDRQSVIDASNEFTAYTAGGLTQPVDWSRQHEPATEEDPATHGPKYDCIALLKVVGGKFQVVGDKAKPWACWPGDTRDWSEPTRMSFK